LVGLGNVSAWIRLSPTAGSQFTDQNRDSPSSRSYRGGELTWYLEKYAIWPSHYFHERAKKVEADLQKWGRLPHDAAMPVAYREEVMKAWEKTGEHAGRRFSVHGDVALEAGAPEADVQAAQEGSGALVGVRVGPLAEGSLDEAFGRAVGLGSVGPSEALLETEVGEGGAHRF